jgi:hypothetical protein
MTQKITKQIISIWLFLNKLTTVFVRNSIFYFFKMQEFYDSITITITITIRLRFRFRVDLGKRVCNACIWINSWSPLALECSMLLNFRDRGNGYFQRCIWPLAGTQGTQGTCQNKSRIFSESSGTQGTQGTCQNKSHIFSESSGTQQTLEDLRSLI